MSDKFPTIRYNEGVPDCSGIFLAAIPFINEDGTEHPLLCQDAVFYYGPNAAGAMTWGFVESDADYRGSVLGWIGPLERLTQKRIEAARAACEAEMFDV